MSWAQTSPLCLAMERLAYEDACLFVRNRRLRSLTAYFERRESTRCFPYLT